MEISNSYALFEWRLSLIWNKLPNDEKKELYSRFEIVINTLSPLIKIQKR